MNEFQSFSDSIIKDDFDPVFSVWDNMDSFSPDLYDTIEENEDKITLHSSSDELYYL